MISDPQPDDERIREAVAEQRPRIERLLSELVRAPTVLGSEQAGQDLMQAAFADLGLSPHKVALDPDALRAHPGASPFSWDVTDKHDVVARWEPTQAQAQGARSLILCGHIDVVSPEPVSLWASPPYEPRIDGDWMYGRGAGDMKAGLAAIVGAVAALQQLNLEPCAPVELQSVVEEECTGNGALQCVIAGSRADGAIITEPTNCDIWVSQVGVLWFEVHLLGRPAHVANAEQGRNAIEAALHVIGPLKALERQLNTSPPAPYDAYDHPINLNIGMIRGGDWPSSVAGECTLRCRLGLYPGTSVEQARSAVEQAVACARTDPALTGFEVTVGYDGFACEGYTIDGDTPLVPALADAARRVLSHPPELLACTGTTDARSLAFHGNTPTVSFGPRAENWHAPDERVSLSSVVRTAQTLAVFVRDWCGLRPLPPRR